MLNADGALKFATAAGSALEHGFFRNVRAQQSGLGGGSFGAQVRAKPEDDLLRVEFLAGIERGAVLGAASALDAGKGLERIDIRDVLAVHQAEVFVARERRNIAETLALQQDRRRAQYQMKMFRMGDEREKYEQRQRVAPPKRAAGDGLLGDGE